MRDNAKHGLARLLLQTVHRRRQKGDIPPELVDDKPLHQFPLILVQKLQGPDQGCQRTAAIDIRNEEHRRLQILCHPHIHDIICLEIDLGRAPRPLDHNRVVCLVQTPKGFLHRVKGFQGIALMVFPCAHVADGLSHEHHLRAGISRGLQEHGIHIHHRLQPRGLRLRHLRASHFQAVLRDIGIERHVLRLEGNDLPPLLMENAAERRRQYAFPYMGASALQHDVIRHHTTSASFLILTGRPQATR